MLVHQILRQSEKQSEWAFRVIDRQSLQVETLVKENNKLRSDVFASESATMALDMELQTVEAQQQSDIKSQGVEAFAKAVDVYQTSQERKALSPERVKELLMTSPGIVTQLVSDDDLVNLFTAEIMKGGVDDVESE